MITRLFNLMLAGGTALLAFLGTLRRADQVDWVAVLFMLIAACWLAGAIGLYFRNRLAWAGSLLGVDTMMAGSLTLVFTSRILMPVAQDPTVGVGFMMIVGCFGLLLTIPLTIGLIRLRKTLVS